MKFYRIYNLYRDDRTDLRCYVSIDVTFHYIDINRCVLWKRTTKIKHTLKRKSGYLWWLLCCRWRWLCLSFSEWQPRPQPVIWHCRLSTYTWGYWIVGSHGAYLFRFRNKWQYQWTTNDNVFYRGIILQYPRYTYLFWSLARVYILIFIWATSSGIAASITVMETFPFRVASMSAVRYDLSGDLPTCL